MALDAGADGVEFDVRLARDDVPVVIHDTILTRTGRRPDRVADLSSQQLGKIDVGSWFGSKFPKRAQADFAKETVPTLAAVLSLLTPSSGLIYIELKCDQTNYQALAKAVCDIVGRMPLLPRVIIKSFKLAAIPEVRHHLPTVQTAALFAPQIMDFLRRRRYVLAIAREFGADQISLHRSLASPKLVSLANEANMPVTVWTADHHKWITRCQKLGIGAVITNDPSNLLAERDK